jgi:HSP20 family protein
MAENNDEKFFEDLANQRTEFDDEYKVELAKAQGAVVRKPVEAKSPKKDLADFDSEPEGQLTVDVYQTPNEIVVESAIAGVKPEDIDVNVTNDSVAIKGARQREREVKDGDYFYQECYWGKFSRAIILPQEVDPDNSTVTFKNGVLTVRMPKLERKKTRKLKVKVE